MKRWLPIRAESMHQRIVVVGRDLIPAATVFPFFDPEGTIYHVLIVDPLSAELSVCQPKDVRKVPWCEPIEFKQSTSIAHSNELEKLAELLHFDPWWLLKEEPLRDLECSRILANTNCVNDFSTDVTGLYFNGGLKKVTSTYLKSSEGYAIKKFPTHTAALLQRPDPKPIAGDRSTNNAGGWRLDPFWQTR